MTTVNRLEEVSFMDAGLDLVSGRKPPDAVLTESQLPARARGLVVSSMDMDFDGRVAGLKCWDVLLLSVFSARAAIVSRCGAGYGGCCRKTSKCKAAILARCTVSPADFCTVDLCDQIGCQRVTVKLLTAGARAFKAKSFKSRRSCF